MAHALLIFGHGYCGTAVARAARAAGWRVCIASRTPANHPPEPGIDLVGFTMAGPAIGHATHLLATAAPTPAGDPVLAAHAGVIAAAPRLRWIGYLSTTGVYGDRAGGWVDEATPPAPGSARGQLRLAAEQDWARAAGPRALDLFRLAGIYGPGRSALDDLRAGRARRIHKPGHAFGRIHRDDIAAAVLAAATRPDGARVLNLNDDLPAEPAEVVREAARLLGLPPPPLLDFATAAAGMSAMALSFWAENRKVSAAATKSALGLTWRHPTYREGLAAILAEAGTPQQRGEPGDNVGQ